LVRVRLSCFRWMLDKAQVCEFQEISQCLLIPVFMMSSSALGLPIIMTLHFPDHVFMVSNKVALMKDGAIIDCGRPDDIVTEANLHRVYGILVNIRYVDGPVGGKYASR
jgi:ABC-type cobalamin/Fe3+-siderophores transport system ATPase subunit